MSERERLVLRLRAMADAIPKTTDDNVYDSVDLRSAADVTRQAGALGSRRRWTCCAPRACGDHPRGYWERIYALIDAYDKEAPDE